MHRIHDCVDTLKRYYPDADVDLIYRAYIFAAKMHRGQTRLSGEPYLMHPIETALILANMKMDVVTVATALLHDVIEDTDANFDQLSDLFGPDVAKLVEGVTKISKIHFTSREQYQAENLRKMLLAMADDLRVLMVKLADRLHNIRTLQFAGPEQQKRVAQETLEIYAPLANRLGLGLIKAELEDLSLRFTDPEMYQQLLDRTEERRIERQQTIEMVKGEIEQKLREHHIQASISGRQKHLYSIFQKMRRLKISYKDVMDVVGLRVITNSKADCYSTLGIIHAHWKYISTAFDDYIGMPKPNMYQSLHTAIVGPFGRPVEIQIRTWEMHHLAEEGVAAHWRYKEAGHKDVDDTQKFFQLRHVLELHQEFTDPSEFLEYVKIDLFPDEVYIFTKDGEVKCLPQGATPVDFAYSIHTEVGGQCIGAKVNDRIVPLRTKLKNGDRVEILTQKNHHPGRDWLNFVVTSKARAKIKHYFRSKKRAEEIEFGTDMLEKELRKLDYSLARLRKEGLLKKVVEELGLTSEDDLFALLGANKQSAKQVTHRLFPEPDEPTPKEEPAETKSEAKLAEKSGSAIKVKGVDNILTRLGNCCRPLPGDKIIGFTTRGRGVTIHALLCPNIKALQLDDERKIEVEWESAPNELYPAELFITATIRNSLLADVLNAIAKTQTTVISSQSEQNLNQVEMRCIVKVSGREHLDTVMRSIRNVRSVQDVTRARSLH